MSHNRSSMPGKLPADSVELRRDDVLRIDDPRSVLVTVVTGRVWLTEEHTPDDVVLATGQCFRLTRPGAAVIEAWEPTTLLLASPHARRSAREVVSRQAALPHCGIPRAGRPWRLVGMAARALLLRMWRTLAPVRSPSQYY